MEREYLDQQRELQKQYQGGEITKSVYDRETQVLSDAQSERLRIQQDYYSQIDALQADWISGAQDGFADWFDEISDVSGTVSDGVKSSLDGVFSNVTSMLEGNKVSWKSWGISVLQIIEKVALQMAVVSAMGAVLHLLACWGLSHQASQVTLAAALLLGHQHRTHFLPALMTTSR
ncbi:phage tail tape measure protein [Pantoea sp. LMR881]|uniref:phage tail tape measure protein n=1 Tax=Pantoea sp. LMR881 TaxID=3014336 RepID=UPI003FA6A18A